MSGCGRLVMTKHDDLRTHQAKGGRPRGALGEAGTKVLVVVKDLVESGDYVDGVTWREVFNKACAIGYPLSRRMAKNTIDNLARAGHIEQSGQRQMQGAYKPLRVFVPASQPVLLGATEPNVLGAVMFRFCGAVPSAANDDDLGDTSL